MIDTKGITILDGQEGGFWDVAFDDDAQEAAGTETGMSTILVGIDGEEVELSAGYEKRSPEGRDERALMERHRPAIIQALADDDRVQRLHPEFVRKAAAR